MPPDDRMATRARGDGDLDAGVLAGEGGEVVAEEGAAWVL